MTILALALGSLALAVTGRKTFGTWFNHVTHYSVIWGISLILFELRFIDYYRLEDETWMYIVLAWVSFTVGALIVPLAGYPTRRAGERPAGDPPVDPGYDDRRVRNAVIAMSAVAGAAVVQHWMILIERFGSVFNVVVLGNLVYSLRVQEGFKFGVPYLDSLALAASFFAGLLISIRQRFSVISVLPFLIVVAEAVGMMGRMKILMSVILFFAGYFLNSRTAPTARLAGATSIVRRWTTVGVAVLLFVASVELVRSSRGSIESIPGASGTLRSLRGGGVHHPIALSLPYGGPRCLQPVPEKRRGAHPPRREHPRAGLQGPRGGRAGRARPGIPEILFNPGEREHRELPPGGACRLRAGRDPGRAVHPRPSFIPPVGGVARQGKARLDGRARPPVRHR